MYHAISYALSHALHLQSAICSVALYMPYGGLLRSLVNYYRSSGSVAGGRVP